MRKRGLSTIVGVLLILVLALAIGAIVWLTVKNLLQEDSEKVTLSGLTISLNIESLKATNTTLSAKIKRNPGEGKLVGLRFVVFDGKNSQEFDRMDVELKPLQIKTFIIDYTGGVQTFSVAPYYELDNGKVVLGEIADIYYNTGELGETYSGTGENGSCTPDCGARECGPVPNGCGTSCGICTNPPDLFCDGTGACVNIPCTPDCSCASSTCIGDICLGGCNETCTGTLLPDCGLVDCGPSPNGCSADCATCESGYHCDGGVCAVDCVADCTGLECGPDPICGSSCGSCDVGAGEWCDAGTCSGDVCTPDCTGLECGVYPICGDPCPPGCNASIGEWCSDGICLTEQYVNNGTVFSIWPINTGIYFDSDDLPKSGVDYTDYYARFPGSLETRCLQIREYVIPLIPEVYNMSHVRFITSSTDIQANDKYEIWETYIGCTS